MSFHLTAANDEGVDIHSRWGVVLDEVRDAIHSLTVMVVAQSMPHDDRSRILCSRLNDGQGQARKCRQHVTQMFRCVLSM